MTNNIAVGVPRNTGIGVVDATKPRVRLDTLTRELESFNDEVLARTQKEATIKAVNDGIRTQSALNSNPDEETRLLRENERKVFGSQYAKAYNAGTRKTLGVNLLQEYKNRSIERLFDANGQRAEVDPQAYAAALEDDFDTVVELMDELDPTGDLSGETIPLLRNAANGAQLSNTREHVKFKLENDQLLAVEGIRTLENQLADEVIDPTMSPEDVQARVDTVQDHINDTFAVHRITGSQASSMIARANDRIYGDWFEAKVDGFIEGNDFSGLNEFFKNVSSGEFFENNRFPDQLKKKANKVLSNKGKAIQAEINVWRQRVVAGDLDPQVGFDPLVAIAQISGLADVTGDEKLSQTAVGAAHMLDMLGAARRGEDMEKFVQAFPTGTNTKWEAAIRGAKRSVDKAVGTELVQNPANIAAKTSAVSPVASVINRSLQTNRNVTDSIIEHYIGEELQLIPGTPEMTAALDGLIPTIDPKDIGAIQRQAHSALIRVDGDGKKEFSESLSYANVLSSQDIATIVDLRSKATTTPDGESGFGLSNEQLWAEVEEGYLGAFSGIGEARFSSSDAGVEQFFSAVGREAPGVASQMRLDRTLRDVSFTISDGEGVSFANSLRDYSNLASITKSNDPGRYGEAKDLIVTDDGIVEATRDLANIMGRTAIERQQYQAYFIESLTGMTLRSADGDDTGQVADEFQKAQKQILDFTHEVESLENQDVFIPFGGIEDDHINEILEFVGDNLSVFGLSPGYQSSLSNSRAVVVDDRLEIRDNNANNAYSTFGVDGRFGNIVLDLSALQDVTIREELNTDQDGAIYADAVRKVMFIGKINMRRPESYFQWKNQKAEQAQ
jgi:hypothetical protein